MTEVVVEYSQQQRSDTGNENTSIFDQIHQEGFDWVHTAKQHNTENGAVKRTPFPSLNGLQEGWAEFRRVFQEVITVSGQGKALELAQLATKLPEEARLWIEGVAEPEEAWRRLDE